MGKKINISLPEFSKKGKKKWVGFFAQKKPQIKDGL